MNNSFQEIETYLNRLEAAIDGSNASNTSSSFDNNCAIIQTIFPNKKDRLSNFLFSKSKFNQSQSIIRHGNQH